MRDDEELYHYFVNGGNIFDLRNRMGKTALYIACCEKDEMTVKKLLNAGADGSIADYCTATPYYLAHWHGCLKIMEKLSESEYRDARLHENLHFDDLKLQLGATTHSSFPDVSECISQRWCSHLILTFWKCKLHHNPNIVFELMIYGEQLECWLDGQCLPFSQVHQVIIQKLLSTLEFQSHHHPSEYLSLYLKHQDWLTNAEVSLSVEQEDDLRRGPLGVRLPHNPVESACDENVEIWWPTSCPEVLLCPIAQEFFTKMRRIASVQGDGETLERLIPPFIDLGIRNTFGDTVLDVCALEGDWDAVRKLILAGQRPTPRTLAFAIAGANESSRPTIVAQLLYAKASLHEPLDWGGTQSHVPIMRLEKEKYTSYMPGMPQHDVVKYGPSTILCVAVKYARADLIGMIVDAGADVNEPCVSQEKFPGQSHEEMLPPLIYATKLCGHTGIFGHTDLLVEQRELHQKLYHEMIEALHQAGADTSATDSETEMTALQHAAAIGSAKDPILAHLLRGLGVVDSSLIGPLHLLFVEFLSKSEQDFTSRYAHHVKHRLYFPILPALPSEIAGSGDVWANLPPDHERDFFWTHSPADKSIDSALFKWRLSTSPVQTPAAIDAVAEPALAANDVRVVLESMDSADKKKLITISVPAADHLNPGFDFSDIPPWIQRSIKKHVLGESEKERRCIPRQPEIVDVRFEKGPTQKFLFASFWLKLALTCRFFNDLCKFGKVSSQKRSATRQYSDASCHEAMQYLIPEHFGNHLVCSMFCHLIRTDWGIDLQNVSQPRKQSVRSSLRDWIEPKMEKLVGSVCFQAFLSQADAYRELNSHAPRPEELREGEHMGEEEFLSYCPHHLYERCPNECVNVERQQRWLPRESTEMASEAPKIQQYWTNDYGDGKVRV